MGGGTRHLPFKVHVEARDGWRDTLQPHVWVRNIRAAAGRQSFEGTEVVAERRSEAQTKLALAW